MNARGQQTLLEIQQAMEGRQSATLVALTTLLDALAKNGETASLSELSALVKCDSHLSARVLNRANKIGVRPGSIPVTSLTQAFHLLGIDRLRSVVLSSVLAHHADSMNHAQREMSVLSLASGLIAQTMALEVHEDQEQAFLCGSLRWYGHLILSTFWPKEFDAARTEGRARGSEAEAMIETFGVTPNELTYHLLEDIGVPKALMDAIVRPADVSARDRRANPLLNLALGSAAFTDLLFDPRHPPPDFRTRAHELLARHIPEAAIVTEEQMDAFLRVQHSHFDEYSKHVEFGAVAQRPMISIGQRINNLALQRSSIVPGRISYHVPPKPAQTIPWQPGTLRAEVLGLVAADLDAQHVLLFDLDPGIGAFRLSQGSGEWSVALRGSRLFATGDKNLFGLCVALRQTLAINDAAESNVRAHIPTWMRTPSAPVAFFVTPLGGATITQVLLVGWNEPRKVVPPAAAAILGYNQNHAANAA